MCFDCRTRMVLPAVNDNDRRPPAPGINRPANRFAPAVLQGTASPAAAELFELYGLKVVPVPTNKPSRRVDHSPRWVEKRLRESDHITLIQT